MSDATRPAPPRLADYPWHTPILTRWADNDLYGHVNNMTYYGFFDTAIGTYLMQEGGLDPWKAEVIGLVIENGCRFHRSVAFPDRLHAGVRVGHLGRSSVRYEVGIFKDGEEGAVADGHFVHVFVERKAQRPVPIPEPIRRALAAIRTD